MEFKNKCNTNNVQNISNYPHMIFPDTDIPIWVSIITYTQRSYTNTIMQISVY